MSEDLANGDGGGYGLVTIRMKLLIMMMTSVLPWLPAYLYCEGAKMGIHLLACLTQDLGGAHHRVAVDDIVMLPYMTSALLTRASLHSFSKKKMMMMMAVIIVVVMVTMLTYPCIPHIAA